MVYMRQFFFLLLEKRKISFLLFQKFIDYISFLIYFLNSQFISYLHHKFTDTALFVS